MLPEALAQSCEELQELYDAIVVDEAQDFSNAYWFPIELLLRDPDQSLLYIFYDQSQIVYRRQQQYPVTEAPFVLTVNCRNTRHIHEAAYRFYRGDETEPSEIDGVPVQVVADATLIQQARKIGERVSHLVADQGVRPGDIAVLVAGEPPDLYLEQLKRIKLPSKTRLAFQESRDPARVLVDTVRRFKGLEAPVVFLWGIDDLNIGRDREILYVGTSRAKSQLYLVGTQAACESIIQSRSSIIEDESNE